MTRAEEYGDRLSRRIDRIAAMERRFDALQAAVRRDPGALEKDARAAQLLTELLDYFQGGLWLEDYASDERGELPPALKRGVLSQDALYGFLQEHAPKPAGDPERTCIIDHYDRLIDEDNDPFRDPPALRVYMEGWDGPAFLDALQLTGCERVLEVGVGTGRLAARIAPLCRTLTGVDLSLKTIARARENLTHLPNVRLICGDYLETDLEAPFDRIYSSLTLMHFADKLRFMRRSEALLASGGRLCLSIDKAQGEWIDMGSRRLRIHPDAPEAVLCCMREANLRPESCFETEFAHVITCLKEDRGAGSPEKRQR